MSRSAPRVIVGLSGGVDSSVAALLLKAQGYDVSGVFMKNWEDSYEPGFCSAGEDLQDAEEVAETLGIRLHTVKFVEEYRERVFAHFLAEHRAGRTPNPDVLCNTEIKFRAFLDLALRLGADYIATGHYARRRTVGSSHQLLKGLDAGKDQSYFLHGLTQQQLARALFPVGELHKSEVRERAAAAGLVTHDKPDSTGICFIGERNFRVFLEQYLPLEPGEMQTPEGERVGQHQGLAYYTLGQRQGLGIGGRAGDSGEPWFVLDKDIERNVLVVGQGGQHPGLFRQSLRAVDMHWIESPPAGPTLRCHAKIRYRQPDQPCEVRVQPDGRLEAHFDTPQRAVTPGQYLVLYDAERCLGGGVIDAAWN